MTMRVRLSLISATIALVAVAGTLASLSSSIGGSALAAGDRAQTAAAAQQRCTNGAVRGIAVVTGDAGGIANLPGRFTGSKAVFARRFNCSGRAVVVRRLAIGVYEVRFTGNAAPTALAGGLGGGQASAERVGAGLFRVSVYPAGRADPEDRGFILVAV